MATGVVPVAVAPTNDILWFQATAPSAVVKVSLLDETLLSTCLTLAASDLNLQQKT